MSNVLIGIIGVILFIGLALAGALFLGPRFQESSSNAEAAASIAAIQQVMSAVELMRTEGGKAVLLTGRQDILPAGYLKNTVPNPTRNGVKNPDSYLYSIHFNNDVLNDGAAEGPTVVARYVMMMIGSDSTAKATCEAIGRQFGLSEIKIVDSAAPPTETMGCRSGGAGYVVFGRI
jgi:type II secretory pathway pseudopilin PulG